MDHKVFSWDDPNFVSLLNETYSLKIMYLLRLLNQIPKQGAVHLLPPLGAVAEDHPELLNAHLHVTVIVHHLKHEYHQRPLVPDGTK